MSGNEDKTGTISFSDQISSRLQRWVQRTTSKVRNDKERSHSVRHRETPKPKEQPLDIKKCSQRGSSVKISRDSRSYEELEKALKDLINNCVSSPSAGAETHDSANISITLENNNNTLVKTNNDVARGFNDPSNEAKDSNECQKSCSYSSGQDCRQENDNNGTLGSLIHNESKQTDADGNLAEEIGNKRLTSDEVNENVDSFGKNERETEREGNDSNHLSNFSEPCAANTSLKNVNKGLTTNNIDDLAKSRKLDAVIKRKPPLRRIQSEGDALELRVSFKDSDVTEFAATCIRHAQKKRFSDITPMKSDFLAEAAEDENEFLLSKNELAPNSKNMPENVVPEINLDQGKTKTTPRGKQPLSDRPSSLSFPLDTPKHYKNMSSSLKSRTFKFSPSSPPRTIPSPISSQSTLSASPTLSTLSPSPTRSTPSPSLPRSCSPKFRKFPCQPVFYVPKTTESRIVSKKTEDEPVAQQSKEYLI